MSVTIKKSDTIQEMNEKIATVLRNMQKSNAKRTFNPHKYLGKLKGVFGDGLKYQKKLRDEW